MQWDVLDDPERVDQRKGQKAAEEKVHFRNRSLLPASHPADGIMLIASLLIPLVTAAPSLPYLVPNRLKLQESTRLANQLDSKPARAVDVSLGVMSHCPDAVLCESVWDKAIDSGIGNQMNLQLIFIGTYALSLCHTVLY